MASPPASDLVRLVARVSHEVVRYWDPSSGRVSWYGNVEAVLGASDEAPPTFEAFLRSVHPDDREAVREGLRTCFEAGAGTEWSRRYRLRHPDDGWREVLERSLVLPEDRARGTAVLGTLLDLDRLERCAASVPGPEREASEVRDGASPAGAAEDRESRMYRALAENASDIITVMAPDGEIRYESPSIERILGYDPEELVGRDAFELIHPDDRERVREAWTSGGENPAAVGVVEYRCRHADGSWRHLESTGRRSPEEAGIDGIFVHSRDVTDRKELESRLEQSRKMETVGRLVGGIAHDFNNLMTVIAGNTEFLLDEVDEEDLHHGAVVEIREASRRAGRLTRHLLAFGRQENLQLRDIDISKGIRGLRPELREVVGDEVELELFIEADPARVRVDPALARQVMLEVVANAADAMPDGGRLEIGLRKVRVEPGSEVVARGVDPGDWVVISYADTGGGMNRRVRERAFEPYFSTREGRAGLGLSMVYGLIKQSRGEVWIESEPGRGTTLWTYLPDLDGEPAELPGDP